MSWPETLETMEEMHGAAARFFDGAVAAGLGDGGAGAGRALWRAAGEAGLLGWMVPAAHGGRGAHPLAACALAEAEGGWCVDIRPGTGLAADMCTLILAEQANDEQRCRWFPPLIAGDLVQAMAMPATGPDRPRLRRAADDYRLRGAATCLVNGTLPDLVYLMVESDGEGPALVPLSLRAPGVERRPVPTLGAPGGFPGGGTMALRFDDLAIPATEVLARGDVARATVDRLRLLDTLAAGARSLGMAAAVLEAARARLTEGMAATRPFDALDADVALARALLDGGYRQYHDGLFGAADAALIRAHLPDMAFRVADRCRRLGAEGEARVRRGWDAARVARIQLGRQAGQGA